MSTIAENLNRVTERIRNAARKAGREYADVTLVCVTKMVDVKEIKAAVAAGARVFGENYVQEAAEKIKKVKDATVRWHLIGHLQKNKVKYAVDLFDVIHTVDSVGLASLINRRAKAPIDVLIQVNISGEETKRGIDPAEAPGLARAISGMPNLNLLGLMAIPPATEDPEASRPYFITLRRLAERINRLRLPGVTMKELSIGMSNDFDVAIEEGATMVRVGTAVFGEREKKQAKAPAEKPPAKKAAPKKKAPAKKPAAKKPTAKKPAAKKPAAKKPAAKKPAAKKPAAKKAAPKKKAPAKKPAAKKAAPKKKAPAKKPAAKKAAPKKKAPAKKTTAKKTTTKKTTAKKTAAKKTKKS